MEACCAGGPRRVGLKLGICIAKPRMWPDLATFILVLCMALYGAVGTLYGAGGAPGFPGAPEKAIGVPRSIRIGARIPGGKLGPVTSKGAAELVLWARRS